MPRGIWKWLTENGCDLVRISVTLKTVGKVANEAEKAEAK